MDFGFTEDQRQLRKTIREFCEAEIKPHVMEWDEAQTFPADVFRKLGRLGALGAVFPEELGGSGYSYCDYAIVMEELARVDPSIALSVAAHVSLCANHIYIAGSEEQKRKLYSEAGVGRVDRIVVLDGAGIRFRRRAGSGVGGARWGLLGIERREDVHYECARRGCWSGDGGYGPLGIVARNFSVHH